MKVIFVSRAVYPYHGYGGMQRYYYFLAKHLAEQGLEVEIISPLPSSIKKTHSYSSDSIKYVFLQPCFKRALKGIWAFRNINYFSYNVMRYIKLKERNFDVVHATSGVHHYVTLNQRKPVVWQPFGLEPFKERNLSKRALNLLLYYSMSKKTAERCDAIASEGPAQITEITKIFKIPKEKIFILPDGVDIDFIEEYITQPKFTREDLGFEDGDLILINVNRLEPNKGVVYLLEALKNLSRDLNVKLILVGEGSQEKEIEAKIKKMGLKDKVLHFKKIPDEKLFQLYLIADISVTPTLYEGLPIVILEAMAAGKPIVASNISDIPRVVKNGQNGFLVPPANPVAIAAAIMRIYENNLISTMGKRSKKIVKSYDWSKIAKIAIKKYEELVSESY